MNIDIKQEIEKYISENIIKTSSFLAPLFGGLVFFIYYFDIKYLPKLNIISSVQLLVVASLTGFLFVFLAIVILLLPSIFWQISTEDSFNEFAKCIVDEIDKTICFALSTIFMYLCLIICISISNKYSNIWLLALIILIIFFITPYFICQKNLRKRAGTSKKKVRWNYIKLAGLSFISSIISVVPVLTLNFFFVRKVYENINGSTIGLLIIASIIILFVNLLAISNPQNTNSIYWNSILGLIAFLILILLTGQTAFFPKTIMKTFKLGNIEASSVILDKQGCLETNKSIEFHKAKDEEDEKDEDEDEESEKNEDDNNVKYEIKDETCIIENTIILSRIGEESYVEIKEIGTEGEKKSIRFPIPSSSIKRWNLIN